MTIHNDSQRILTALQSMCMEGTACFVVSLEVHKHEVPRKRVLNSPERQCLSSHRSVTQVTEVDSDEYYYYSSIHSLTVASHKQYNR